MLGRFMNRPYLLKDDLGVSPAYPQPAARGRAMRYNLLAEGGKKDFHCYP